MTLKIYIFWSWFVTVSVKSLNLTVNLDMFNNINTGNKSTDTLSHSVFVCQIHSPPSHLIRIKATDSETHPLSVSAVHANTCQSTGTYVTTNTRTSGDGAHIWKNNNSLTIKHSSKHIDQGNLLQYSSNFRNICSVILTLFISYY